MDNNSSQGSPVYNKQPAPEKSQQPQNSFGTNPQNNANQQPQGNFGGNPQNNANQQPQGNFGGNPQNNANQQPQGNFGGNPQNNANQQPQGNFGGNPQSNASQQPQGNFGGNPQSNANQQPQGNFGGNPQNNANQQPQGNFSNNPQNRYNRGQNFPPFNSGYSKQGYPPYGYQQNSYNYSAQPQQQYGFVAKAKKIYDKTDKLFAVLAFVMGFLFVDLIVVVLFDLGIGASIFFIANMVVSYLYLWKKKNIKIDIVHNITFVLLILFSLFFTFFSNSFVLAIDFAFLIPAQCFWVYTTNGKNRVKHGGKLTQLFVSVFYYPFANYGSAFSALFNKKKGQKGGNGKWIILGLCIALPLVAIVSALLLMGDQMFKAMFSFIFDDFFQHLLKYVAYAILGIPVAMAIFSCLYTKYNEETPHTKAQNGIGYSQMAESFHIVPAALMYSIVIPLCAVYFMYLISQLAYFVSFIADNLLPQTFTIVDYARNGFFELCVITAINIIIILLLILLTKRKNGAMPMGLRIITVIMCAFTLVFVCTALFKMLMYINQYGFTALRINTSIFMLFLFVMIILVIVKQFFSKVNLFSFALAFSMLFLIGYNVLNIDSFIAQANISLYQQGKIEWMGNNLVRDLDPSAYKYIAPFAADEDNGLTNSQKRVLNYNLYKAYKSYNDSFASFNVAKYQAHKTLEKYGFNNESCYKRYHDTNDDDYSPDYYSDSYSFDDDYSTISCS